MIKAVLCFFVLSHSKLHRRDKNRFSSEVDVVSAEEWQRLPFVNASICVWCIHSHWPLWWTCSGRSISKNTPSIVVNQQRLTYSMWPYSYVEIKYHDTLRLCLLKAFPVVIQKTLLVRISTSMFPSIPKWSFTPHVTFNLLLVSYSDRWQILLARRYLMEQGFPHYWRPGRGVTQFNLSHRVFICLAMWHHYYTNIP